MTAVPSVFEAWAAVMADVGAVAKDDRNEAQGFNFRGIDAVRNAVGPALRAHKVAVIPIRVRPAWESYQTRGGTVMRNCTVRVTYRVTGPAGDCFVGESVGESADAGDKSTSKALSVAARSFLLDALCIPTTERDPDADAHERAAPPVRAPELGPYPRAKGVRKPKFDPERFVAACRREGVEPDAVIERAQLGKAVSDLRGSDRPRLYAALTALVEEAHQVTQGGDGEGSGGGSPVLPHPDKPPDPDPAAAAG